jgi:hypothetical protein
VRRGFGLLFAALGQWGVEVRRVLGIGLGGVHVVHLLLCAGGSRFASLGHLRHDKGVSLLLAPLLIPPFLPLPFFFNNNMVVVDASLPYRLVPLMRVAPHRILLIPSPSVVVIDVCKVAM